MKFEVNTPVKVTTANKAEMLKAANSQTDFQPIGGVRLSDGTYKGTVTSNDEFAAFMPVQSRKDGRKWLLAFLACTVEGITFDLEGQNRLVVPQTVLSTLKPSDAIEIEVSNGYVTNVSVLSELSKENSISEKEKKEEQQEA